MTGPQQRNGLGPNDNGRRRGRSDRLRRAMHVRDGMQRTARRRGSGRLRMVRLGIVLVLAGMLSGALLLVTTTLGAYAYFARDLPAVDTLDQRQLFQSAFIYDRNGELLYELFDPNGGRRIWAPLQEVSPWLLEATLATEDPHFWTNPGVDVPAIGRALLQNVTSGQISSGASTITQQLVRNVLIPPGERYSQDYLRKVREAILAFEVSQRYSKEQILEMYLNEIYYGNLAYGIGAASWIYFGKHARDLTLGEATLLAGLPQAPVDYDPYKNARLARTRQAYVLDRMVTVGFITEAQAQEALREPMRLRSDHLATIKAPHFVWYVRDLVERRLGRDRLYSGGLRIYTTLDLNVQRIAEEAAKAHIAKLREVNANNAAVVVIEPKSGEILAMVGSVDYWDQSIQGEVNVTVAERQPGSALKPITYVTALERGYGPATVIRDQPISLPQGAGLPLWQPRNHDGKFRDNVTIRQALAPSLNIPAVLTLQEVGLPAMLANAHRLGITTLRDPQRYGLAITLGGGEVRLLDLTFAYTVFANGGAQVGAPVPPQERQPGMREYEPVAIRKIEDAQGQVLVDYRPPPPKQILRPEFAYEITDILADDLARAPTYGRNSVLVIDRPAAVKTGTTDSFRDGWTVGYTPDLAVGVWTGNTDNAPMKNVFGASGAGVIWNKVMIDVHRYLKLPPRPFTVPPGIRRGEVCGRQEIYVLGQTVKCWLGPGAQPTPTPSEPAPVAPVEAERPAEPAAQPQPSPTPRPPAQPPTATPTPRPPAQPTPPPGPAAMPPTATPTPTPARAPAPPSKPQGAVLPGGG